MFMVDIASVRILYTGDYSREEDRHLRAAETPQFSPDICIIESTYGVQLHQPRHVIEKRFTDVIHTTIAQRGRVLIPTFALCRALGPTIPSFTMYLYTMLLLLPKGAWPNTRPTSMP
ncbi:Cleavage and polyadenylation specificity factor subunit 3-I [Dionaea muscipula]